ncbi:DNA repair protein RadA [Numidum massiliense]|uniref:DNA repair protein RadA n=1 Tax=Numidum massiliense TaxID=1522315 RepID=UPI0006D5B662|nr:DNA repair protein RadA [Numidum massiliense]
MAKVKTKFVCQQCGLIAPKWLGKCPGCGAWNTLVEEREPDGRALSRSARGGKAAAAKPITSLVSGDEPRFNTGIKELNRVLGGGLVPGSLILVGGDPGIGKSTLLLQASYELTVREQKVLYVSGEESVKQLKLRADRIGALNERLYVATETSLPHVEQLIEDSLPTLVVIDSIQTVYHPDVTSAPGSVAQVRECTAHLMRIAKLRGIAVIIVGHVTKEGAIAGPRLLEHMVDCVLYFEGERFSTYRIVRAVKNRFGSTNEIGLFEMKAAGLSEVENPSELFLSERPEKVAGSVVVASLEGTRPVLVELQALVTPTAFATPRRMATGVDYQRVSLLIAVLEKRIGLFLQNQDAYVNVAGGVRLDEPAVDLGIALSIASSFRDTPSSPHDVFVGEVGLTGEIRAVTRIEQRVHEAAKLGFQRVIVPQKNIGGWEPPTDIELCGVRSVEEAMEVAFGGNVFA